MRKRRQDKTLMEGKRCKHCKKPSYATKEKIDNTHQAKENSQQNKFPKFYKGQKILWHQRMNKPGPGKFRIRWSGLYEITEIYGNNIVDVSTLQGENLGRVNMSKIKPYHEPLEAKAYVLEVDDATNSPLDNTSTNCINGSIDTNHHKEESSHSRKPCSFYEGQRVVTKHISNKQVNIPFEKQEWVGPYTITRIHEDDTIEIKTIHHKQLGRWRSKMFLPYDRVNPNQVNTFDQRGMKISTSPDYDEVHHKLLECYFAQPLPNRAHRELNSKVEPKMVMKFYPSKDGKRKLYTYNDITTRQAYTIPQRHYDIKTCAKDITNHPHHKELATKSLSQACKTKVHLWSILYALFMIRLLHHNGNLTPKWEPSIHSSIQKDTMQPKATRISKNFNGTRSTLKPGKHQVTRNPNLQYKVHRGHAVTQFYVKKITTQKEVLRKTIKSGRRKGTTPYQHKGKNITIPCHLRNYRLKIPSWNGQLTPIRVTELPECIITRTLITKFP